MIVATTIEQAHQALGMAASSPVQVSSGDLVLRSATEQAGWQRLADAPFDVQMRLDVDRAEPPALPPGYRLRSVAVDDDLVGAHRASWSPPQLPFAEAMAPMIDPEATSGFDAVRLAAAQSSDGYELAAHPAVEAPDGELAASCIAWHGPTIDVTSIESLGVHPDHRRLGLAGALTLGTAAQAREREIGYVVIHPRGDDAYPAPRLAYRRVGFVAGDRTELYVAPH